MGSLNQAIISHRRESKVRMASQMFTDLITKAKQRLVPQFAKSATNINPHHRISVPRLRHVKKNVPRRLRLPKNLYNDKEVSLQRDAVSNYHKRLDPKYRKKMEGRARAIQMQFEQQQLAEHKANKPTIVED